MKIQLVLEIDDDAKKDLKAHNELNKEGLENIIAQQLIDLATIKSVKVIEDEK